MAIIISLRGLLLWTLGMALVTYIGGAAVLTRWLHHKPFNRITYVDLISAPWRSQHFNKLRGQANIDQAREDLKNRNIRSAFAYFRSGVARNPEDGIARLELATIYIIFRIRPAAEKLILQGFDYTYPGYDYLEKAVSILEAGDNPELLLKFCARARTALAATSTPAPRDARFLNEITVKVLTELGRLDDAVKAIEELQPVDSARLAKTKIARALELGDFTAALAQLDDWLARSPDDEDALSASVGVYRQAGKLPEMKAAILRLRSRFPKKPEYIGLGIAEYLLAGQTDEAFDLLDISFYRFSDKPAAFGQWAEAIGKTGRVDALTHLERLMRETKLNPQIVTFTTLMLEIRKQDWVAAMGANERLDALYPNVHPRVQDLHRVAKALLETCRQPVKGAQNTLTASIAGGWLGLPYYRQIIDSLVAAERYEAADEVLTLAEGYYPTSRYVAIQRAEVSPKLAAQLSAIADNPAKAAAPTLAIPSNAEALFAILDSNENSGRNDESLRLIRAVRNQKPAWLRAALSDIEWREIQIAAASGDTSLLQLDLRSRLRAQNKEDIDRALALARKWHAEDRGSVALVTVREVLKAVPNHADALTLVSEWSPASEIANSGSATVDSATGQSPTAPAIAIPPSSNAFFKTLDTVFASSGAEEATRFIRAVRRAEPAWLHIALPELEWREILLAVHADDLPLLQLNLRTHLRSHPDATTRCLTQARAWHKEGKTSAALVVVREVIRQTPADLAAQKLLSEWTKP